MLYVIYFKEKEEEQPILVAAFLMKTDAEVFMKGASLSNYYYLKETSGKAWSHWSKIREDI